MKNIRLIAVSLMLAAFLTISAAAQATTPAAAPAKIALINTAAFENQGGITRMINARNTLEAEFKKQIDDLQKLETEIKALQAELQRIQQQLNIATANKEALQTQFQTKYAEFERKSREYKFKEEDLKVAYQNREQIVMGPVMQDIGKAMEEYCKSKGFTMMWDLAKLYNAGVILYWENTSDVTADFIKYYNARPAPATTTR